MHSDLIINIDGVIEAGPKAPSVQGAQKVRAHIKFSVKTIIGPHPARSNV